MQESTALVNNTTTSTAPALPQAVAEYITRAKAQNTLRAYRQDWAHFEGWAQENGYSALPATPQAVAAYLAHLAEAGYRVSTIERRASSIAVAHRAAGFTSPTDSELVRTVRQGIRRTLGTAPVQKAPLRAPELRAYVLSLGDSLLAKRDRALLLLGYAGAFRRSELVALNVEDLHFTPHGVRVTLRRSKTDQEGQGQNKAIPYGRRGTCPVRALQDWLASAGITSGAVFRSVNRWGQVGGRLSDKAVSLIVKRACEALGLPAEAFGGHSLRAGLATDAYAADVPEAVIQQQTGHRSSTVLRRYRREADLWRVNVLHHIDL